MAAEERSFQEPDYDFYDLEDEEEEGGRGPILVVVAIIVLTAFVGVVLVAYNQGLREGRQQMPPILHAENGPVKEAPADTGETDRLGSLSQQALNGNLPADSEVLAPPPEEPIAPMKRPTEAAVPAQTAPPLPPAPTKSVEVQAAAEPAAAPPPAAPSSTPAPTAVPAPQVAAAPPTKPVSSPAAASGAYVVQIGSFRAKEDALATWQKLQAKYQDILGSYSPNVATADLGAKGVYHRLRFGPFDSKEAAAQVCDELKAHQQACLLAKP